MFRITACLLVLVFIFAGINAQNSVKTELKGNADSSYYNNKQSSAIEENLMESALSGINLIGKTESPVCRNDVYQIYSGEKQFFNIFENDDIRGKCQLEIISGPSNGEYELADSVISYTPHSEFIEGNDTIQYRVKLSGNPEFRDSALVIIVKKPTTLDNRLATNTLLRIYPNPAQDFINIYFQSEEIEPVSVEIRDVQGRTMILRSDIYNGYPLRIVSRDFEPGIYLITLSSSRGDIYRRFIKK